MAYYLQFDGVDDRIITPNITFTEVIMDFRVIVRNADFARYWSLPTSEAYFQMASGKVNDQWSTNVTLYKNGTLQSTNLTPVMNPLGTRALIRGVIDSVKTRVITIGANGTNVGSFSNIELFGFKVYNGATLVLNYDFTLGTVDDQSGNGRHGTLFGGTWISDGPIGTDVSVNLATKQVLTATRTKQVATKQVITASRQNDLQMKEVLTASREALGATKQIQTALRSVNAAMKQVFFQDYVPVSLDYLMRINFAVARLYNLATKQVITKPAQQDLGMEQRLYLVRLLDAQLRELLRRDVASNAALRNVISAIRTYRHALRVLILNPDEHVFEQRLIFNVALQRKLVFDTNLMRRLRFEVPL